MDSLSQDRAVIDPVAEIMGLVESIDCGYDWYGNHIEPQVARDALESALRKLVEERDAEHSTVLVLTGQLQQAREYAERAEAEAAALRKLLEPLAALAQPHNERIADDIPLFSINGKAITAGDARAAKAALAAEGKHG